MWPFDRLSPRTRKLMAAFAISAQLLFSFKAANAESAKAKQLSETVRITKDNYYKSRTEENALLLMNALQLLINQLESDAKTLPAGSRERKEIDSQIARLQTILASIQTTEIKEVTFPPNVSALIQSTAQQIANGSYDLSKPLVVEIKKGKPIVLLTSEELKKISEDNSKIRNPELKKQQVRLAIVSAILRKPDVTRQFPESK